MLIRRGSGRDGRAFPIASRRYQRNQNGGPARASRRQLGHSKCPALPDIHLFQTGTATFACST